MYECSDMGRMGEDGGFSRGKRERKEISDFLK